jgi:vesicle transport protein SEC22
MLKFTLISRCSDALPLAASMDNTVDNSFSDPDKYKLQAKNIFKELMIHPPPRLLTITSGEYSFHLLTENGVSFLTLCETKSPSYLAFSFLEDLNKEFQNLYGQEVARCERPYAFIKFDTFLQKTKKVYMDTRSNRNLSKMAGKYNATKKGISEVLGWVKEDPVETGFSPQMIAAIGGGVLGVLLLLYILYKLLF